METDSFDVVFPKTLSDYLEGKTPTLTDLKREPDTTRNPGDRNTAGAPGEPSPAARTAPCENEPNEPGASGTTSREPQATSGREAPRKSRAEASRENGRKSRGPKTPEGKARSSRNALKHGLTARFVTINSEEEHEWESFLAGCREELQPVGVIELSYADEFASSRWRLRRCLGIETVIFDDEFAHQEAEIKKYTLIDDVGRTGLAFKKAKEDLNALGRYETRIRRAGERALANLLKLQSLRPNEPEDPERDPEGDSLWVSPPAHEPPDPEGDTLRVSPPANEPPQNEPGAHAAGEPSRGRHGAEPVGSTITEPAVQNEPGQASSDASPLPLSSESGLPDSAKNDTFTLERPYANGHPDPFRRTRCGANAKPTPTSAHALARAGERGNGNAGDRRAVRRR